MDELSSLSFLDRFSDLALFITYGLLASLAGGAIMGIVDVIERLWLKGNISKAQYGIVLGITFFIGLFVQWELAIRELDKLKTQSPVTELQASIKTRDTQLAEKDRIVQDLKHERDLLALRNEALVKEADAKSHRIGQLENTQKDKARRQSIRNHLSKLLAETEAFDKVLSVSQNAVSPLLITTITAWENKAMNYISRELGEAEALTFKMAEGERVFPPNVVTYRDEWLGWWNRFGAKKAAIEKLQEQLGR